MRNTTPRPFEIYGASTALLRKFQSSTYHRYASGWNLLGALYLQNGQGCPWFPQQRCFCSAKTRVQKCTRMYTSGQAIFKRLTESRILPYVPLLKILNVS